MINEATLRMARYYPELIPDTAVVSPLAASEAVPPILDLRRFSPLFLQLHNIAVDRLDTEQLIIRADRTREAVVAGSLIGNPAGALGGITPSKFSVLGTENLYYNIYSTPGAVNFRTYFGVWAYLPTVAHKLKAGKVLTPEESRINKELGISDTVDKGLLPLPIPLQIEREYQIIDEITRGFILTVPTVPGVELQTIPTAEGEFLVLTKIATDPNVTVVLTVDRDDDANYISLINTLPLSLDFDLECFLPATKEIRILLLATVGAVANFNIRFTFLRCKMNNTLRARWGLVTKDELPEPSLFDKVRGGIV